MKPLPMLLAASLVASPAGTGVAAGPAAPAAAAAVSPCAAERAALEAERSAIDRAIADIALGKHRKRRKASGGEVAAGVAGTAASVLLPFGIGALLGAGASAAARSGRGRKPAAPQPDVPAMIDRLHAIDARLAELGRCGE